MHDPVFFVAIVVATLQAATPLMLAGIGELVAERSGVLNLGVEGMMLVGASAGFVTTAASGNLLLGLIAAAVGGMVMAGGFAILTLFLLANQVATGLALTIFGVGLSALMAASFQSLPVVGLSATLWPNAAHASPVVQQLMLLDPLVWLAILSPFAVGAFLARTRAGLVLRAVGEKS